MKKTAVGEAGGGRGVGSGQAGLQDTYVHLGGWGEPVAQGSLEGRDQVRAEGAPQPPIFPAPLEHRLTSGSSLCFMVAQAVGSSGGLLGPGGGGGGVPAGDRCEFQLQPHPSWPSGPPRLDSPRGLERGSSSAGGSAGDGPKNGARLMVPVVSSGESSSWEESQRTEPGCQQVPRNLVSPTCTLGSPHPPAPAPTPLHAVPGVLRLAGWSGSCGGQTRGDMK